MILTRKTFNKIFLAGRSFDLYGKYLLISQNVKEIKVKVSSLISLKSVSYEVCTCIVNSSWLILLRRNAVHRLWLLKKRAREKAKIVRART